MNFISVLWLSACNSAIVVLGITFACGLAFGSPPTFFMFLKHIEDKTLEQGMIIAIAVIYGLALLIVIETGFSWAGRYKADFINFRTIMGVYTYSEELKRLKDEQYAALKEHIFHAAFVSLAFIETAGVFFIEENLTGRWGLQWVALFATAALLQGYTQRTRGTLRLSQDKALMVAEKQARAMSEAYQEELEDRDDIEF